MIDLLVSLFGSDALSTPLIVGAVALTAVAATPVTRFVTLRLLRSVSRRGLRRSGNQAARSGLWRARAHRVGDESPEIGEQRRRQRIDAASRMVNHLVSVVVWIIAVIVVFHLLDIDPAFFLSSAGFIGAGLAIGGQHKVNDYLTGLSVHFEDRYGVGDEIVAEVGWSAPVCGLVDHVGLFSTRIRDERSTVHVPNSALTSIRNLSQEAAALTLRLKVPDDVGAHDAADVLRGLAGSTGLTDVVFVGEVEATDTSTGEVAVAARTSRNLDDRRVEQLVGRVESSWPSGDR